MDKYEIKYDFGLDLTTKNSLKLINDRIKDNSLVLEFGPANGRFTKHLKINRSCEVDIVEINPISGKDAAKYARKALIGNEGNIETLEWLNILKGEKYDYIIFADVLEHLRNPEEVLDKCRYLLKDNGVILISVPNISNNNIILNLLRDEFNYTPTGLLDDTHIHFFTYRSLDELIQKLKYYPTYIDGTIGKVGETEVKVSYADFVDCNTSIIKKHQLGDVYQYIYEISLNQQSEVINNLKECFIPYIPVAFPRVNDEYIGENVQKPTSFTFNEESIEVEFDLTEKKCDGQFRIDPAENVYIECEIISIETDVKNYSILNNGVEKEGKIRFLNTIDPMIFIDGDFSEATYIKIRYKIKEIDFAELNKEYNDLLSQYNALSNDCKDLGDKYSEIVNRYNELDKNNNELKEQYNKLDKNYDELKEQYNELDKNNNELKEQYNELDKNNNELKEKYNEVDKGYKDLNSKHMSLLNSNWHKVGRKIKSLLGEK